MQKDIGEDKYEVSDKIESKKEPVIESKWIVDLQPDAKNGKKELCGPFLLTISQNLEYVEYNSETKTREPTLRHSKKTITKDELAAIVKAVPNTKPLSVFISDGLNKVRYDLINSLSFEAGERKSRESSQKTSKEICVENGQLWREENKKFFEECKERPGFKVFYASEIMETDKYKKILDDVVRDFKDPEKNTGQYKKLWDTVKSFAKQANTNLHCTILNSISKETPYYFQNQEIPKEELEQKLLGSCIDYTLQEIAIISWLAQETNALIMFYKKKVTKEALRNEHSFQNELDFGHFAPTLVNKTLELYAPQDSKPKKGHQKYKMIYTEFSSQLEVASTLMKAAEEKNQQILEILKLICGFKVELSSINPLTNLFFDAVLIGINDILARKIIKCCGQAMIATNQEAFTQILSTNGFIASSLSPVRCEKPEKILADMIELIANILANGQRFPYFVNSLGGHIVTTCKAGLIQSIFMQTAEIAKGDKPGVSLELPPWSVGIFGPRTTPQAKDKVVFPVFQNQLLS